MSRKERSKTERQEYNQKILKEIRSMVANNPDLRFGQILQILNIVETRVINKPLESETIVKDNFYTESKEIYNQIINKQKWQKI